MEKALEKFEKYTLYTIIFLFPFFFAPISPNAFIVAKLTLLTFGLLLLLLIRSARIIGSGKLEISTGTFDLPIAIIAIAYLASAIFSTPNKMEAFLLPGTATAVVGGALIYFFVNQLDDAGKKLAAKILFLSGTTFSIFILLAFSGIFGQIPQLPEFMKQQGFTPDGGPLPGAILLGSLIPIGIGLMFSTKDVTQKILLGTASAVVLFGLVVTIYNIFPGQPTSPRFPDFGTSWSIAVDSLKENPILGVGPGNYITAFNRFRPLSYNNTELWAVRFSTARDYYITLLTETGLLGFSGIVLLGLATYRSAKKSFKENKLMKWGFSNISSLVSLILLIALMAVFPATITLIFVLFVLFALNAKTKKTSLNLISSGQGDSATQNVTSKAPALIVSLPIIVLVLWVGFRAVNIVRAEYVFKTSLDALNRNEAQNTYDRMRQAINLNPQVDRYHSTFSRVNLLLANSIAQNAVNVAQNQQAEGEQPIQISEQDRNNIAQLIQTAIAESKATVALNPLRAGNWQVLASTYQSIIPFAQGADAFAAQTFRQALALDPINPNLRIALGGVYYAAGDFENAIRTFELAAQAKPDLANAHYNLAFALAGDEQYDRAVQEMTVVLSLIERDSQDYEVARQALEQMQEQAQAQARQGQELTAPQEGQEQVLEPPLDLPEGSEPPESPITPTPTPDGDEDADETGSPTTEITPTPEP